MIFQVNVSFVNLKKQREYGLNTLFLAETPEEAAEMAVAWARNRHAALSPISEDYESIGSIKMGSYSVMAPEKNGLIRSGYGGTLFEWKMDHYDTPEQAVVSFKARK